MKKFFDTKGKRLLLSVAALLLLLTVILFLYRCSPNLFERETLTEEEYIALADRLTNNIEAECNNKFYYVSSYLEYWDFPSFEVSKLKRIERYYAQKYYKDLGYSDTEKILERAVLTAEFYIGSVLLDEEGEYRLSLDEINDKTFNTDNIIRSYISTIGDKYSVYYSKTEYDKYIANLEGEFAGIGVYVELDYLAHTVTVYDTLSGSAAEEAGILPGDLLYKIDDKLIDDYDLNIFMDFAKGEVGSLVTVTVLRGGKEVVFEMNRVPIESPSVGYTVLEGGIAYVYIESFNANTDEQFIEIMDSLEAEEEVKGYIFDLRYNGGGFLDSAVNILSYFVPKGTNIVSQGTKSSSYWHTSLTDHVVTRPMAVICNGYTASAGELFTAAIRDYRDMGLLDAVIVGETTYSKGKVQSIYTLGDGSALVLTTGLFNPPSDVNFDGMGVAPDVTVEFVPDPEIDNQYNTALDELTKLINNK